MGVLTFELSLLYCLHRQWLCEQLHKDQLFHCTHVSGKCHNFFLVSLLVPQNQNNDLNKRSKSLLDYRALISMHMTGKHDIHIGSIKQWLHRSHHFVPFSLMSPVTVIPWRMKQYQKPRCLFPVYFGEICLLTQAQESPHEYGNVFSLFQTIGRRN